MQKGIFLQVKSWNMTTSSQPSICRRRSFHAIVGHEIVNYTWTDILPGKCTSCHILWKISAVIFQSPKYHHNKEAFAVGQRPGDRWDRRVGDRRSVNWVIQEIPECWRQKGNIGTSLRSPPALERSSSPSLVEAQANQHKQKFEAESALDVAKITTTTRHRPQTKGLNNTFSFWIGHLPYWLWIVSSCLCVLTFKGAREVPVCCSMCGGV